MAGHQELAFLILHVGNGARDGGAIDVNVEDIQKDAQARFVRPELTDGNDAAVGGRDKNVGRRCGPFWIAEEIQAEER